MRIRALTLLFILFGASVASSHLALAEDSQAETSSVLAYYLALGDSIPYGMQEHKLAPGVPASAFDSGYVDVLASKLEQVRPGIVTVNYSCPGETSTTFIEGGCIWTETGGPLHDEYEGSQSDAAVAFLRAHPGQVSPITIHLFGNDVSAFFQSCDNDLACLATNLPAEVVAYRSRMHSILQTLRSEAPDAQIIVTSGWNPRREMFAVNDAIYGAFVNSLKIVAAVNRATLIDLRGIFNPETHRGRLLALCVLTLTCSNGDTHPSDLGYQTIANAVFSRIRS